MPLFCSCGVLNWSIYICWAILVPLEWIPCYHVVFFNFSFWFASIFLELLHPYSSEILVCSFLFCVILARFWYHAYVGLIKCDRKYCLFFSFLEEFGKDRYQIFFECLLEFRVKPSGPGFLFLGRFLTLVSISSPLIGLFRFSFPFVFWQLLNLLPKWHLFVFLTGTVSGR